MPSPCASGRRPWGAGSGRASRFLFKVAIVTTLVSYFVAFVAMMVAMICRPQQLERSRR